MFHQTLLAVAASMIIIPAPGFAETGPSSSRPSYLLPLAPGVEFTSILSVGDAVPKDDDEAKDEHDQTYRMVGIPDGLGAYDHGKTITVLMNHEVRTVNGVPRAHGGSGAFVSKWEIRKKDLKVLNGKDLMQKIMLWDSINQTYVDGTGVAFSRLCSADLAPVSAFYNKNTKKGFKKGRIYLNGEEDDAAGRAVAHLVDGPQEGTSYELPKLGRYAWENLLASPYPQDKTIVVGTEDGGLNRVLVYIGKKQEVGSPIEMAGLTNGTRYEVKIAGYTNDDPVTGFKNGTFSLVSTGGTSLARPEDGAWDTVKPNRFYFVTTASILGNSRLWRMVFDDITRPERGGKIEVLVEGDAVPSPQIKMMDNMTVDEDGNVYMQEDVGNNVRLGQVWMYNPNTKALTDLGQHDPARFLSGGENFLTQDEESSGIIDVTHLFRGVHGYDTKRNRYFLLGVQAHYPINAANPRGFINPDELVEGGQLLMMKVPVKGKGRDKGKDKD